MIREKRESTERDVKGKIRGCKDVLERKVEAPNVM